MVLRPRLHPNALLFQGVESLRQGRRSLYEESRKSETLFALEANEMMSPPWLDFFRWNKISLLNTWLNDLLSSTSGFVCCVEEYCCSWHIVGWMGTQRGGMRGGGDLRSSDPEWVPCPPVALPRSAPNSWASPAFGQPPLQTNSRVHVPFSELLGGKKNSFILFSARCPVLAPDQHIHAITRAHTGVCAWMQTHRLRFRLLIHKVFSKAVIYPIGLSLNAFEWDQSNYNLQCLMVKREKARKEKSQWNKADSAFMWLCFWKPLWTRGGCVPSSVLSWLDNTSRAQIFILNAVFPLVMKYYGI